MSATLQSVFVKVELQSLQWQAIEGVPFGVAYPAQNGWTGMMFYGDDKQFPYYAERIAAHYKKRAMYINYFDDFGAEIDCFDGATYVGRLSLCDRYVGEFEEATDVAVSPAVATWFVEEFGAVAERALADMNNGEYVQSLDAFFRYLVKWDGFSIMDYDVVATWASSVELPAALGDYRSFKAEFLDYQADLITAAGLQVVDDVETGQITFTNGVTIERKPSSISVHGPSYNDDLFYDNFTEMRKLLANKHLFAKAMRLMQEK